MGTWVLSHAKTGRFLYMRNGNKYKVGSSQQSDLRIRDDKAVSNEHAVLHHSPTGVQVQDLGSEYGTFVNKGIETNERIVENKLIALKIGDSVRFGHRLDNEYRLVRKIDQEISTVVCEPPTIDLVNSEDDSEKEVVVATRYELFFFSN